MPEQAIIKNWRFMLLGVLVSYGALWVLDFLLPEAQSSLTGMYAITAAEWTFAFSLGGYVAGRGFLVPALASALFVMAAIVLHTAYLSSQYDQPVLPVITYNLPILAITAAGAAVGAFIGMWFTKKVGRRAEIV